MPDTIEAIRIDYVDYGVNGEYGFFGKVVARSDVSHLNEAEISKEISEMQEILGSHVVAVRQEWIPALPLDRP